MCEKQRFRSMTPMYYRGASAAILGNFLFFFFFLFVCFVCQRSFFFVSILVYDITSVESFECVKDWVVELRTQVIFLFLKNVFFFLIF